MAPIPLGKSVTVFFLTQSEYGSVWYKLMEQTGIQGWEKKLDPIDQILSMGSIFLSAHFSHNIPGPDFWHFWRCLSCLANTVCVKQPDITSWNSIVSKQLKFYPPCIISFSIITKPLCLLNNVRVRALCVTENSSAESYTNLMCRSWIIEKGALSSAQINVSTWVLWHTCGYENIDEDSVSRLFA